MRFPPIQIESLAIEDSHFTSWFRNTVQPREEKTFQKSSFEKFYRANGQYDIDGKVLLNTARYINHSCDPNCITALTPRSIWVLALRDIQAGEELTFNYRYETKQHRCHCGA